MPPHIRLGPGQQVGRGWSSHKRTTDCFDARRFPSAAWFIVLGMTSLAERLVPDELWELSRRVVPETVVVRPQGGGRRRAGDRECLAGRPPTGRRRRPAHRSRRRSPPPPTTPCPHPSPKGDLQEKFGRRTRNRTALARHGARLGAKLRGSEPAHPAVRVTRRDTVRHRRAGHGGQRSAVASGQPQAYPVRLVQGRPGFGGAAVLSLAVDVHRR
jgi:hypothetical protein